MYLCKTCGCESCDELINKIDEKLARIGNHFVDNMKYELATPIDKELFKLLVVYKEVLESMCCGCNCCCVNIDPEDIYERVRELLAKNSTVKNF